MVFPMVELVPLAERIGVEALGIDVNCLGDDAFEAIYNAWIDSTILLIRGQSLTREQQLALTDRFGSRASYTRPQFSAADAPEMLVLSNLRVDGTLIGSPVSGRVWHSDGHYLESPPAGSLLHAAIVPPEGGDTLFANQLAAYADLPDIVQQQIETLEVVISRVQSRPYNYPDRPPPTDAERADWRDVVQPIVKAHAVSGRKALYAGGNVPWKIVGMDVARSMPLITFLQEFSVLDRYVYRHRWQPGDIIVWDNRSALHKATWYDGEKYQRLMYRTTFGERMS
jgi:alpha-ketoglutarate-dependent taurine dioxygenase